MAKIHEKLIESSRNWRNFEAMKKMENQRALLEYGFSNTGELRSITTQQRVPLSAGMFNLVRQILP